MNLRPLKVACGAGIALLLLATAGCRTASPATATDRERLDADTFLTSISIMEGLEFDGEVDGARTLEDPFEGQPLVMRIEQASRDGARIVLHVGEDRSRTWVLTRENGRLRLRHDHRDPDGTPHEVTDYGGLAAPGGTSQRQSFPADEFTAQLIPEAKTNVWTLKIDHAQQVFIYDLTRHDRPRFRAVFDLSTPRVIAD